MKRSCSSTLLALFSQHTNSKDLAHKTDLSEIALRDVPLMATRSVWKTRKEESYKSYLKGLLDCLVGP